jgi:chromosomal replication initiation ATPase DnaA
MNAAHDDVLAKMDALLKKHHDGLAHEPSKVDFPVLTEVVEEHETAIPVLTEVVAVESVVDVIATTDDSPSVLNDSALSHLDPQLRSLLEQQLSTHVIAALDQALAAMLDQFSEHLESMVRDAVAQELQQQLPELLRQGNLRNKL